MFSCCLAKWNSKTPELVPLSWFFRRKNWHWRRLIDLLCITEIASTESISEMKQFSLRSQMIPKPHRRLSTLSLETSQQHSPSLTLSLSSSFLLFFFLCLSYTIWSSLCLLSLFWVNKVWSYLRSRPQRCLLWVPYPGVNCLLDISS